MHPDFIHKLLDIKLRDLVKDCKPLVSNTQPHQVISSATQIRLILTSAGADGTFLRLLMQLRFITFITISVSSPIDSPVSRPDGTQIVTERPCHTKL